MQLIFMKSLNQFRDVMFASFPDPRSGGAVFRGFWSVRLNAAGRACRAARAAGRIFSRDSQTLLLIAAGRACPRRPRSGAQFFAGSGQFV